MTKQIDSNAENAIQANNLFQETSNEIEAGNQKMQEMIAAMQEIEEKSAQIEDIIKTIEAIAFQTNMLALNAAIEAERAGTAGKGFVVIAEHTAQSLKTIVEKSSEVTDRMHEIADASKQQSQGAKQVSDWSKKISSIVHANSLTAQQSAATSEELSGQSQILNELVGKFQLGD